MSMISELVEKLRRYARFSKTNTPSWSEAMTQAADVIEALTAKLRATNADGGWITCEDQMPEEHDSCLAKWYGTDGWDAETMWRKQSDDVLVTMEFEDGSRKTEKMNTHDGKWFYSIYVVKFKVIAWRPLPEPYREVRDETD